MADLSKNRVGFAMGKFFALIHLIWAILVLLIPQALQKAIDWMMNIHGIESYIKITSMTILNAVMLIIMTFIAGYVIGWLFAWIYNYIAKYKCCK